MYYFTTGMLVILRMIPRLMRMSTVVENLTPKIYLLITDNYHCHRRGLNKKKADDVNKNKTKNKQIKQKQQINRRRFSRTKLKHWSVTLPRNLTG